MHVLPAFQAAGFDRGGDSALHVSRRLLEHARAERHLGLHGALEELIVRVLEAVADNLRHPGHRHVRHVEPGDLDGT